MTEQVQRRHLALSFNQLLDVLGVEEGQHITRVWAEDGVDYLHLIVEPGSSIGGFIEEEYLVTEKIDDVVVTRRFGPC